MSDIRKRARACLIHTWEVIGGDILQSMVDAYGDDWEGTIPRDHVIEVVLDADHYVWHGGDTEAAEYIKGLDYRGKIQLCMEAFEFENYGW